ncbi:MAG: UDP-2,3-diacylglucosamine diphosphatase [Gammaproteobacteria bacterium]|nr:UDP-2,3-diacylglucosamine diphosphatase [Gammaproteobacteria bacterium]
MQTLFFSDLHLSPATPQIAHNYLSLLQNEGTKSQAIYILGDFFEYWLGDDGITPQHQPILEALQQLSTAGIELFFMHGNRDFLIGEKFCELTGCTLLADPTVIDLYGTPTLLMHGDLLCTDDHEYLAFRQQVRDPKWQQQFLAMDMNARIEMAKQARDASKSAMQDKAQEIMDVNQTTVESYMHEAGVQTLIHGHTHRPAIHEFILDDKPAKRIVLGDWGDKPSFMVVTPDAMKLTDPRV